MTTGTANTAIGYQAMLEHQTGGSNTVIGHNAMNDSNNHAGEHNVFVGTNSGAGGWAGAASSNTALGSFSFGGGAKTAAAIDNVAVGRDSLYSLTTGAKNDGIGKSVGTALTQASENVLIGMNTGKGISTQGNNTYVGFAVATNASSTGHSNTLVGSAVASGGAMTGNNNVGMGRNALLALTSGSNNVALGYQAGDSITSGGNNTIIGDSISADTATTSDQTVIGNAGIFKFVSKEYTCDHASNDDNDVASSEANPLKIPARAVIKSVSAIASQLSNLGTYELAIFYSDDTASPSDDAGLTNGVELIGAGNDTTNSGGSGNAIDIEGGSGATLEKAYYNGFDGNGKHGGTGDRYIHIVNAGTGNGDTDPSTAAKIKVLVEYVGMD